MATSYNCPQEVAVLVCFAGCNQRIVINPKKCIISDGTFNYASNFKASDGRTYNVCIVSLPNQEKGYSTHANVHVYYRGKLVADRKNVAVRFSRKLFK